MDIYFNCNQCGKCCNSNPVLMFSEIIENYKSFIILFRFFDDKIQDLEKNNIIKYTYIDSLSLKNVGRSIHPFTFEYKSKNKCSMLNDDNTCKMYHQKRLEICKVVPFHATVKEEMQFKSKKSLDFYISNNCISTNTIDGYIPIYSSNRVLEPYKTSIDIIIKDFADNSQIIQYMSYLRSKANPVNNLIGIIANETLIYYLISLLYLKKITENTIRQILESQITLLDEKIKEALIRKNKDDKEQTSLLRDASDVYKRYLDDSGLWISQGFEILNSFGGCK